MTRDFLADLGQNALAFARAYTSLKEALVREGVEENEARTEARNAATIAALSGQDTGEKCPLCGD